MVRFDWMVRALLVVNQRIVDEARHLIAVCEQDYVAFSLRFMGLSFLVSSVLYLSLRCTSVVAGYQAVIEITI